MFEIIVVNLRRSHRAQSRRATRRGRGSLGAKWSCGVGTSITASAWFGTGGVMVSYVPAGESNDLL